MSMRKLGLRGPTGLAHGHGAPELHRGLYISGLPDQGPHA